MSTKLASALAALAIGITLPAAVALAQPATPPADAMTDPALKREDVIAFIGVKPGDKVADIVSGRFVRALSAAVGPKGKVYAVMPAEVVKVHPEVEGMLKGAAGASGNVEVLTPPVNAMALPAAGLDAVFIRQNYHDLYDKFMGPADVAGFNKQVFAALKPGGVYVILDHAAAKGAPDNVTETLHRIDEDRVKKDVLAAGFKLDGESKALANAADDHSKMVFDPSIRGKTDQFLLRFRKPK
ncbi:MAG: class I SAM-dependent methyltransferase [Caulobacterales bacterium]|nr:class I SAM-dependent methyltransferase [Caulobacterales bacterium]